MKKHLKNKMIVISVVSSLILSAVAANGAVLPNAKRTSQLKSEHSTHLKDAKRIGRLQEKLAKKAGFEEYGVTAQKIETIQQELGRIEQELKGVSAEKKKIQEAQNSEKDEKALAKLKADDTKLEKNAEELKRLREKVMKEGTSVFSRLEELRPKIMEAEVEMFKHDNALRFKQARVEELRAETDKLRGADHAALIEAKKAEISRLETELSQKRSVLKILQKWLAKIDLFFIEKFGVRMADLFNMMEGAKEKGASLAKVLTFKKEALVEQANQVAEAMELAEPSSPSDKEHFLSRLSRRMIDLTRTHLLGRKLTHDSLAVEAERAVMNQIEHMGQYFDAGAVQIPSQVSHYGRRALDRGEIEKIIGESVQDILYAVSEKGQMISLIRTKADVDAGRWSVFSTVPEAMHADGSNTAVIEKNVFPVSELNAELASQRWASLGGKEITFDPKNKNEIRFKSLGKNGFGKFADKAFAHVRKSQEEAIKKMQEAEAAQKAAEEKSQVDKELKKSKAKADEVLADGSVNDGLNLARH